jgi:hypothetical protein
MALQARNESSSQSSVQLIAATVVIALTTCAFTGGPGFEAVGIDQNKIETGIQQIRQLKLKTPVPIFHKTRAQAAQIMLNEIKQDKSQAEQDDARVIAGTMLGRYHRTTDVKAQSVKLYLSQIDAFYDSHKKEMVILEGARRVSEQFGFQLVSYGDWRDNMILAHELTHALQDQNFEIGARSEKIADNSDSLLAFKSLIEGDATLAGFAYIRGGMDDSLADFITAHLSDLPQVSAAKSGNVPDALSIPFLFQYAEGTAFVREAYRRGGWDSVDAAFRNPPESSQQIIDPSLYFDHLTRPLRIEVDGYQHALAGWTQSLEDTYGELALRLILQLAYGKDATQVEVARRWAGDQMVVLTRGKDETVIWMVAFSDEQGASLFADFYRKVLDTVDGPAGAKGADANVPAPHNLAQVGKQVLVVVGPGATQFATLAPAVWKASKVIDPNPPPPPPVASEDDQTGTFTWAYERLKNLARDWFLFGAGKPHDPLKY